MWVREYMHDHDYCLIKRIIEVFVVVSSGGDAREGGSTHYYYIETYTV